MFSLVKIGVSQSDVLLKEQQNLQEAQSSFFNIPESICFPLFFVDDIFL